MGGRRLPEPDGAPLPCRVRLFAPVFVVVYCCVCCCLLTCYCCVPMCLLLFTPLFVVVNSPVIVVYSYVCCCLLLCLLLFTHMLLLCTHVLLLLLSSFQRPPLLLVSLDGLRADYLQTWEGLLPVLSKLGPLTPATQHIAHIYTTTKHI